MRSTLGQSRSAGRWATWGLVALSLMITAKAGATTITETGTVTADTIEGLSGNNLNVNLVGQPFTLTTNFDPSTVGPLAGCTTTVCNSFGSGSTVFTAPGYNLTFPTGTITADTVNSFYAWGPLTPGGQPALQMNVGPFASQTVGGSVIANGYNLVASAVGSSSSPIPDPATVNGSYSTSVSSNNTLRINGASSILGQITSLAINAAPSTPPPTLRQLAQASSDVYSGNSAPTTDGTSAAYTFLSNDCLLGCTAGSRAAAYISPDGSQIIVSIRGTNLGSGNYAIAALKDLLADGSFVTDTATSGLEQETAAAAAFLRQIESQYPNATITLTGHSLGGAIAQALAEYSGLTADTFNAPGVGGALYNQLVPYMLPVEGGTGASITNYRIYGDQYSLFGSPLPGVNTVTLPSVVSDSVITANPSEYIQLNHSISTVFTQITGYENGTVTPDTSTGPNITAQIEADYVNAATEIISTTPADATVIVAGFTYVVTLAEAYFFDPSGGTDFLFTETSNSPNFACINLPAVTGVGSYDVRSESGNRGQVFKTCRPAAKHALARGLTVSNSSRSISLGREPI